MLELEWDERASAHFMTYFALRSTTRVGAFYTHVTTSLFNRSVMIDLEFRKLVSSHSMETVRSHNSPLRQPLHTEPLLLFVLDLESDERVSAHFMKYLALRRSTSRHGS